jgi:hypothetical protein
LTCTMVLEPLLLLLRRHLQLLLHQFKQENDIS